MEDDFLVAGTTLLEGWCVVCRCQVAPKSLEVAGNIEVFEGLRGHPQVLQLGQHDAVQVVRQVSVDEG